MTSTKINFILLPELQAAQDELISLYGGLRGIRDIGMVESAISSPTWRIEEEYLHEFPCGMAAAYLFFICKNHGFVDGNKRTSVFAAVNFLRMNGYVSDVISDFYSRLVQLVVDVADNKADKQVIKTFLQSSYKQSMTECTIDEAKKEVLRDYGNVLMELANK